MARLIVVAMRLLVWCLLSADLEAANLAIGLAVALALPQPRANRSLPLAQLLQAVLASLRAVPQAYGEAFQLVLRRPARERLEHSPVEWSRQGRSQGRFSSHPPAALVFLDVFRITLTPLTIALGMDAAGTSYRVHRLEERR
jgi:multicomponent Na+:H+ antiporter subunit E